MNSTQLLQFKAVAKEENITKAAEKLYISSSALSQTISKLENELNCKLFTRSGRRIKLNEKGQKLLIYAEEMETLLARIKNNLTEKKTGTINIASYYFTFYYYLFADASNVNESKFHYDVVDPHGPERLIDLLLNGDVQVVVDYDRPEYDVYGMFIEKKSLCIENYLISVPKNNMLYSHDTYSIQDLRNADVQITSDNYTWLNEFSEFFKIPLKMHIVSHISYFNEQQDTSYISLLPYTPSIERYQVGSINDDMHNTRKKRFLIEGLRPRNVCLYLRKDESIRDLLKQEEF